MSASYPRLRRPEGFGDLGGIPIRQTAMPEVDADPLASIRSHFANQPEPIQLPDWVVAMQGPVTKESVGALLSTAAGQGPLTGVSATDAITRLQQLGMPSNANDWTPSQWEAQIATHAATPSALSLLGY